MNAEERQIYFEGFKQGKADAISEFKDLGKLYSEIRADALNIDIEKPMHFTYEQKVWVKNYIIINAERQRADAIEEYKAKCQQKFNELQFKTGRAWFDFDAGIGRCLEILDKVAEQLKEQNNDN